MATEKSSFAVSLTKFFTNLFHHFPKLLLTNLLFAVPAGVFFAIFWIVNVVTGINSNFILFLHNNTLKKVYHSKKKTTIKCSY